MSNYTTFRAHLTPDMMREIGGYTHKDEAGRRVYLSDDLQQIGLLCGVIRLIPAQVHPATGLSYSADDPDMGERIEVHPEAAEWFDCHGDLAEQYDADGLTLTTPYVWPE